MYQFSGKLKSASIILMIAGLLGIAYGFWSAPSSVEEAKEYVLSHGDAGAHGASGHEGATAHSDGAEANSHADSSHDEAADSHASASHSDEHYEHAFHQLQNKAHQ